MGRVDTDTDALERRIKSNAKAAVNLEEWIDQYIALHGDEAVLDLGSGTGKQAKFLAAKYPHLKITALDISTQSLQKIDGIATICADMDTVEFRPEFDLVLSTYSFYYSANMIELGKRIKSWLKPGGRLAIFGPGAGTNRQLVSLIEGLLWPDPDGLVEDWLANNPRLAANTDFINEQQLDELAKVYTVARAGYLANTVRFSSRAEFLGWWENHNSYWPEIRAVIEDDIPDNMRLTKNVYGIILAV